MKIIAAVDHNYGIGKNVDLPGFHRDYTPIDCNFLLYYKIP